MNVLEGLEAHARREMLRWHCGHQIFCKGCQGILDCRRAVEVDVEVEGKLASSLVVCTDCYERVVKANVEAMPSEVNGRPVQVKVNDGRVLFPSKARARAAKPRRAA